MKTRQVAWQGVLRHSKNPFGPETAEPVHVHTVIALSERARSSFRSWSVLFDPFIETGILSVCDWNQHSFARTLSQAIPNLQEAIKGKGEWRVIVVDTGAHGSGSEFENPFDFVSNAPVGLESQAQVQFEDSKFPVIRLTHMLLGFPDLGTKSFAPDASYVDRETGRRIYESEFVQAASNRGISPQDAKLEFHSQLATQRDVQVHFKEEGFSLEQIESHARVSAYYRVKHAPPSEVVLIATRDPVTANPTSRLRKAWGFSEEDGNSRFVERNNFPASCRFGVYDLHYREHTEYELDQMRFWLSVLTVATNILPPSSFQSERVYKLGLDIDNKVLGHVLNTHLGELASVRDYLDAQIRSPKRSIDHPLEKILKERVVQVSFENLSGEGLHVSAEGYGLAADSGMSDTGRWASSSRDLNQAAEVFIRQPRRVLSRTVAETRMHAQNYLSHDVELTDIEVDELREELTKRTSRLTQPATVNILNREKLMGMIKDNNKRIQFAISMRLRVSAIVMTLAFVLIPWLMVFVPYLLSAWGNGANNLADSLLVIALVIFIIVAVALGTLYALRYLFIRLIRRFNEHLRAFKQEVQLGANAFSKYLTDLATYMYGSSVLISSADQKSSHQKTIEWLFATRKKIIERIDSEKTILRSVDHSIEITKIQYDRSRVDNFGFAEYRKIFRLPTGRSLAELNNTGERINAPYAFVERLRVENIGVREMIPSVGLGESRGDS